MGASGGLIQPGGSRSTWLEDSFLVLDEMMEEGEALYDGLARLRASKILADASGAPLAKRRRKKPRSMLEPW